MQYWLMKSEPDVWSIDQQIKSGAKGAPWDGVRNHQAAKNLRTMKKGDLCFFYHSNIGKEIVGVVKDIKEAFIDKTDKNQRFVAVQVRFVEKFKSYLLISELPLLSSKFFFIVAFRLFIAVAVLISVEFQMVNIVWICIYIFLSSKRI